MSDYAERLQRRLREHMNEHVDVMPPWSKIPEYTQVTIGWRMGYGEAHWALWGAYLATLTSREELLAHLERHGPAPRSWAHVVAGAVFPSREDHLREVHDELEEMGLIASDAAFGQFARAYERGDTSKVPWEWETSFEYAKRFMGHALWRCGLDQFGQDTPEHDAWYHIRPLWLHGRLNHARRAAGHTITAEELAPGWKHMLDPLNTGVLPELDPNKGLASLAIACAAGRVPGPWELGLTPDDITDDRHARAPRRRNYADTFVSWVYTCLDDRAQRDALLGLDAAPAPWRAWFDGLWEW
jgi:hypothetical protein